MLYPINFSIPESKVINIEDFKLEKYKVEKKKILSTFIPGNPYLYNNEEDYYNEYKMSLFATTFKKGGWDCMRHYEIIANGCIPYFPDINDCPVNTMTLLPKDLIIKGNILYYKLKNKQINELTNDDFNECYNLMFELLKLLYENLTTKKMAEYILKKSNHNNVKKILYLSGDTSPDYLRCLTLSGFKELFGKNCHDYPKIEHIYKNKQKSYDHLYGIGFTYTNNIDEKLRDNELDNNIIEDIKNKKYDIIIYGSYMRGIPYYDLISNIYSPNEIILLCGEDHMYDYDKYINNGNIVFMREIY